MHIGNFHNWNESKQSSKHTAAKNPYPRMAMDSSLCVDSMVLMMLQNFCMKNFNLVLCSSIFSATSIATWKRIIKAPYKRWNTEENWLLNSVGFITNCSEPCHQWLSFISIMVYKLVNLMAYMVSGFLPMWTSLEVFTLEDRNTNLRAIYWITRLFVLVF